jgi:hypothetical protein
MIKKDQAIAKSYLRQRNKGRIRTAKFTKWLSKVR